MSFSKFAFTILYGINIFFGYCLVQHYIGAIVVAAAIPLILVIWQKISLYKTGAVPIEQCRRTDAYILNNAYEAVMLRASNCGFNLKKAKLYISDQDTYNAYNCGNAIIVNKPVLYDSSVLEGVVAHEVNHHRCADSWFSMLLGLNISVSSIILSLSAGLYVVAIIAVFMLIFSIFFRNSGWLGLVLAKILMPIQKAVVNIMVTTTVAVEMAISRGTEYKADEFASTIGYGSELKLFLSRDSSLRKPLTFTERLLSTHPSDDKRIAKIERYEQKQLNDYYGI